MLFLSCSEKPRTVAADNAPKAADSPATVVQVAPAAERVLTPGFVELDNYLGQFALPPQLFTVGADSVSVIEGKKGSRILVVPADLETTAGVPVTGKINVELIELHTKSDFLRQGITTTADGRLLESGGSYYINMRSNGRQLQLKSGKTLLAMFPKITQSDMQLFYGDKEKSGDVNWKAVDAKFVPFSGKLMVAPSTYVKQLYFQGSGKPGFGKQDTIVERYEIPKFKDTILQALEGRPKYPQKVITAEMRRLYPPVDIRIIDEKFYIVGRVRDTFNRWYGTKAKITASEFLGYEGNYYEAIKLSKFNWWNCDGYLKGGPTVLEAQLPDDSMFRVFEFYCIYSDVNSVSRYRFPADAPVVSLKEIVRNKTIKVVALSWKNGSPYAQEQTVQTMRGAKINIDEMKPVNREELQRMLSI